MNDNCRTVFYVVHMNFSVKGHEHVDNAKGSITSFIYL